VGRVNIRSLSCEGETHLTALPPVRRRGVHVKEPQEADVHGLEERDKRSQ
jgi:hypothetical protein